MSTTRPQAEEPERKRGRVARIVGEFGFISSDEVPGQDVYFKTSWFRGLPALQVGDNVTFELKRFGDRVQAHALARIGEEGQAATGAAAPVRGAPATDWLLNWAYLGYLPRVLGNLRTMALRERWEFKNTVQDPDRPWPILCNYLYHTFGRLVLEEKVLVNQDNTLAAFNTGLVDPRYEPIYALFAPWGYPLDSRRSHM